MNKNLIALFAATALTTSAFADISITGEYEGIIQDGNPGAATYEQDLDLNIVGSAEAGKATIKLENKTGSDSLVVQESYVEAGIEGLDFKGTGMDFFKRRLLLPTRWNYLHQLGILV